MSQHYTKNTIQAESCCKTCGRATPHHVSDGKLCHCLTCAEQRMSQPKPPKRAIPLRPMELPFPPPPTPPRKDPA